MKGNRETDELLCSFIDGELPLRQQTEVQRLAARDPEVAHRLRQLQNCKNLVGAFYQPVGVAVDGTGREWLPSPKVKVQKAPHRWNEPDCCY